MIIGTVLLGIVIVIIGVVEWFGKITVEHSIAILTIIVGLWVALTGGQSYYSSRGGRGGA